jgi:transposase
MPVEITRTDLTSAELRGAAKKARTVSAARRMLALAMVLEGASRTQAAEACGMTRQTLRDWVHRYNDEGLEGLYGRHKNSGRQSRLTPEQEAEFAEIVLRGPDPETDGIVRWRRVDLRDVIAERYGADYHFRSVGKILNRLGFSCKTSRPSHPMSDPEAQAAFKKTSHKR